jgi:hypothetical protein
VSDEYAPPLSSLSPESVAELADYLDPSYSPSFEVGSSSVAIGARRRVRRRRRRPVRRRAHAAVHARPRYAAHAALALAPAAAVAVSRGYAHPGSAAAPGGEAADDADAWADEQNAVEEDASTDEAEDAVVGAARRPPDPHAKWKLAGGWYRKPLDALAQFEKQQGRDATDGDKFQIAKLVAYGRDGIARGSEEQFERAHEMLWYLARTGQFPGGKARKKLEQKAAYTVQVHVNNYHATHHSGFWDSINPVKAVTAAAKWAGRAVGTVAHAAGSVIHEAADVMGHIPIVGGPLHTVLDAANPFNVIEHIAKGERIDKAVLGDLKNKLAAVKEVAPYAAMVASMVPGVGSGVAAALNTAVALSSGRSITEAVAEGVRDALPGGAAVRAAFDTARALSKGERIDQALLETARNQLPAEARGAFDTGLAVAHGQNLQKALVNGVQQLGKEQLGKLADIGDKAVGASATLAKLRTMVPDPEHAGFNLGLGVMAHTGVTPAALYAVRMKLTPESKRGFDKALVAQTKRAEVHVKKLVKLAAKGIPGTLVVRSHDPRKNGRLVQGNWRAARPGAGTQGIVVHGKRQHLGWWTRAA